MTFRRTTRNTGWSADDERRNERTVKKRHSEWRLEEQN